MTRLLPKVLLLLILWLLAADLIPTSLVALHATARAIKIAPEIQYTLAQQPAETMVSVIVTLKSQADLSRFAGQEQSQRKREVVSALRNRASGSQKELRRLLAIRRGEGKVQEVEYFWIFNGLAVTATSDVIAELAARPEVRSITPNTVLEAPAPLSGEAPSEPNLSLVNAPALWNMGFRGQGIVVANLDTGVDLSHPDLVTQWRGGNNSWFDPNGEHPTTPTDVNGHGTWTMGVMVGRDSGGTAIGVAPDAQWIAVKIFDDQGLATVSAIHQGYQWLLDPDGNPNTDDAPDVVNNSWTFQSPGCNLEFQLDLQALRAGGIVPVFAAGNQGPGSNTSPSPSNYPESFAVGATNQSDQIYTYSSRGPSDCGESPTVFPEVVAPGVWIRSTDLYGLYYYATGTSLAAPHVAGGLALLLSAFPNLNAAQQESALMYSATDLGVTGPDHNFGYGRINLLDAYQWVLDNAQSTPTITPTYTPSATPTPLPTYTPVATHTPAPSNLIYLSLANSGSYAVGSVVGVRDEDILRFDGANFTMFFDGSDVGVAPMDVSGFAFLDADTLLLSFDIAGTISGLGAVDDSDIVRFDAASLGPATSGTFSFFFDGSLNGLETNGEAIDAIVLLPDGRLLLSARGTINAPGLTANDEDLVVFTPTNSDYTSGTWALYFDGSDVGLADGSAENVDGVDIGASGQIYLTTLGNFAVNGLAGADEDIFVCTPTALGPNTSCNFGTVLIFDGSQFGLAGNDVDALDVY